jgi:hypothetical protein
METTRDDVLKAVINALKEAQADFPDDAITIVEGMKPIGELKFFDSLVSVGVTLRCLDALGYKDDLSMPTLFIDKHGTYLTVGEVVDRIVILLQKKK